MKIVKFLIITAIISILGVANYAAFDTGSEWSYSNMALWAKILWDVEASIIALFIWYYTFIWPYKLGVKKGKKLKLEIQKDTKHKQALDNLDKEKLEDNGDIKTK